jgi:hypothetical protein
MMQNAAVKYFVFKYGYKFKPHSILRCPFKDK